MINAVAPRTHRARSAFGSIKDGIIKIQTISPEGAAKLNGALHSASERKNAKCYVPTILKSSFDREKDTIELRVAKDINNAYYDMIAAANHYANKVGATIVTME